MKKLSKILLTISTIIWVSSCSNKRLKIAEDPSINTINENQIKAQVVSDFWQNNLYYYQTDKTIKFNLQKTVRIYLEDNKWKSYLINLFSAQYNFKHVSKLSDLYQNNIDAIEKNNREYFLTYAKYWDEYLESLAKEFNVPSEKKIISNNRFDDKRHYEGYDFTNLRVKINPEFIEQGILDFKYDSEQNKFIVTHYVIFKFVISDTNNVKKYKSVILKNNIETINVNNVDEVKFNLFTFHSLNLSGNKSERDLRKLNSYLSQIFVKLDWEIEEILDISYHAKVNQKTQLTSSYYDITLKAINKTTKLIKIFKIIGYNNLIYVKSEFMLNPIIF